MTIRESINQQFSHGIPSSKRETEALHMAKYLASYGWAKKQIEALKKQQGSVKVNQ